MMTAIGSRVDGSLQTASCACATATTAHKQQLTKTTPSNSFDKLRYASWHVCVTRTDTSLTSRRPGLGSKSASFPAKKY
jgi:hypothetical protein